jgi:sugar phosphate isomerase/epimerase
MHLGIFAKTFPRPTLEETLDAVVAHGLTHIQFNMSCLGLPTLPDRLDEGSCVWIAQALHERGLTMAAISGTFNMSDPSDSRLQNNLRRLEVLASACRWLDVRIITLCTGTCDSHDMWRWHIENVKRSTWERLVQTMSEAVKIADRHEVTLAFEPEYQNVISSTMRARRLLDEIGSPWLKVVIDPANLLHAVDIGRFRETLNEAFDWLGGDIVLAHAKNPPGIEKLVEIELAHMESLLELARGRFSTETLAEIQDQISENEGDLELGQFMRWVPFYQPYLRGLAQIGYGGALIMHGFKEDDVSMAAKFLGMMVQALTVSS